MLPLKQHCAVPAQFFTTAGDNLDELDYDPSKVLKLPSAKSGSFIKHTLIPDVVETPLVHM